MPPDITFTTFDGVKLAGTVYTAGEKRPTIIMTQGFSGLRKQFLPDFAERFVAAGFTTFIYDNRCWGDSEGMPRNHVDPILQTRDYFDAFNFVKTLPDVDPENIIYWGSSMSGGNVIAAAAVNKTVKAVIAQVPFVTGEVMSDPAAFLWDILSQDRANVASGKDATMAPIMPETEEQALSGKSQAMLNDPNGVRFTKEMDRRGYAYEKTATLQSLIHAVSHEPRAAITRITPRPLLFVIAENDAVIPSDTQLQVFSDASDPKRLHIIKGAGHFDPYFGVPFEENIKVQLEFLKDIFH
ncbi:unnamed protein product [Penicillium salamii]|uniref:Serine aminopeptidase S33 domain-containing protein n=1 Tax=Penicillium solitum TaxID=60172 RepID=A0A1V6R8A7_9EURO|nr:uncharacterized protein PENSOL_c011G02729 [Penicillium solitum]OQD97730.1 hypothetical protein PENSOL_c011G02729 [Penicillium solitum]CAG8074173.1 unnamed protein product [Penicillium salamii]CAG8360876.1 unnamed protein product [Penicillium salamii]